MLSKIRRIVRTKLARRLGVPEIPFALERLKVNGFSPQSIFDVGAYRGEFAEMCLRLWPETNVTCFEVLPGPSARILELAQKRNNVKLVPTLLGAKNQSTVEFSLAETASSVLVERENPVAERFAFPMRTLDDVMQQECQGRSPDFLKLDVQGYELEVLKGATHTLPATQLILAEVNLLDIHLEVPLLSELVSWLSDRGWVAYDICGLTRRPLDRALWQCEMVTV